MSISCTIVCCCCYSNQVIGEDENSENRFPLIPDYSRLEVNAVP